MRSCWIVVLFVLVQVSSSAQLMRSQIYDFLVGDYYGMKFYANNGGTSTLLTVRYQMFHILSKQISVTTDSVSYTAQRQTYIPPLPNGSGGNSPAIYTIDTISFMHDHLNVAYSPNNFDMPFGNTTSYFWDEDTNACYNPLDTIFPSPWCFSNAGQAVHFGMEIGNMDSCSIEPIISEYQAFSNAGGPYGGRSCPGDPSFPTYINELFYVVHNGVECGQFPSFFLKVEENQSLYLEVYPNPVQNQLTLVGVEVIKSSVLYSSDGKIVNDAMIWNGTQLDVSNINSGIYFLKITDETGKIGQVRFVK